MNNIDDTSEVPFYLQIKNKIMHQINSGVLKPGDMIPTELDLCKMYGVSRTTMRQALDLLVEENIIVRRRGKGSFVNNPKLGRRLDHIYSFTEDMRNMGLAPYSKVNECIIEKADKDIADKLDIPQYSEVFKLVRVRCANDEPILFETTYVPLYLCKDILKEDFEVTSLYSILRMKYNLNMIRAEETYEAVRMQRDIADILKCKSSCAAFKVQRVAFIENDVPFEYTYSIVRSDKCIFKVELKADKRQTHFSRELLP